MTDIEYIHSHFPLLSQINSPADLRALPVERLPEVCAELRGFIIHELAGNPGHFASSMGAVEINVALHYAFNTPDDRIVWDVGHQAYAHKIITGRRDCFSQNRKLGGLSGFPNPEESPYDTFAAGHASNSISAALGMQIAAELTHHPERKVVAVIGDASISGGLAFEGLNNASIHNSNLTIVLNDNDMSIDANVGSLAEYISELSTSSHYNTLRYKAYRFLRRHHVINDNGKGIVLRFNNAVKSLLTGQQNIFEGLNIRYFGPFDGHDVVKLVKTFREIKNMTGPKLIHLHTRKGKGFAPAEADPTTWHAPGCFDETTGERLKPATTQPQPPKFQDVMGETLVELARSNDRIVGITAAMPSGTSMSKMQEAFPQRTFDVGISEGHAVTFAGGLAKDGMRPYCAIYSAFLQRGFDEIIHDVALLKLPVTFCIDRAGLVGEDGATHHGAFDLAYMRLVPNMTVAAPINEHALRNLMYTAQARYCGPMAIRYPRGKGSLVEWRNAMHAIPIGKGQQLSEGERVAVLSIGTIGNEVTKALQSLAAQGVKPAHYDMIFLKPIDEQILAKATSQYRCVITVEDGTVRGGLGSAVAEWIATHGSPSRLVMLGLPDAFVHQGTVPQLRHLCGIDAKTIARCVLENWNQTEESNNSKQ